MRAQNTVWVSGANGYLGSHIVRELLSKNYSVHGVVRDLKSATHLRALEFSNNLKVFRGDLVTSGSYDESMEGCSAVIHVASPCFRGSVEDEIVKPALLGVKHVVASAIKNGIKKIIFTSSAGAIYDHYGQIEIGHVFTSIDWSNEDLMREHKNFYGISKLLSEKLMWKLCKENGIELSVMNPVLITGPPIKGTKPGLSIRELFAIVDGTKAKIENACRNWVDVRDVAEAHVAALTDESFLEKRVILNSESLPYKEVAEYFAECASDLFDIPTIVDSKIEPTVHGCPNPHPSNMDSQLGKHILKAKRWITVRQSVFDTVRYFRESQNATNE